MSNPHNGQSNGRFQFSLRSLLIVVSVACLFMGIPLLFRVAGGLLLPVLFSIAVLVLLMLFQFPLYRVLKRLSNEKPTHEEKITTEDTE